MSMEALLSNLNENETIVIDQTSINSYVKCIVKVAIELSLMNTEVRSKIENIVDYTHNNVKYLKDTKNPHEQILLLLDHFQESVNIAKSKFSDAYQNWLQNYFKKHCHLLKPEFSTNHDGEKEISLIQNKVESIVEIDDSSDSDVEVVHVVKYSNFTKRTYSSMAPRIDDDSRAKESMAPRIDDHSRAKESMAPRINDCISIAEESIESIIDNCNLAERDISLRISTEEGNSQEDNKANDEQDDLQENVLLKNKINNIIHLEELQEKKRFKRLLFIFYFYFIKILWVKDPIQNITLTELSIIIKYKALDNIFELKNAIKFLFYFCYYYFISFFSIIINLIVKHTKLKFLD